MDIPQFLTTTAIVIGLVMAFAIFLWIAFFGGWNYVKAKLSVPHCFISRNPEYPDPEPEPKGREPVQTKPRDKDIWKHWMKR